MNRGEVWWADLPAPFGRRPVLLLSRTDAYRLLTSVVVAPLTTSTRNVDSQVHLLPDSDHVHRACSVSLDNLLTVERFRLDERMTTLTDARMDEVEDAIHFALGLRS